LLLSSRGALLDDEMFRTCALGRTSEAGPTLAHGQRPAAAGWHVMRTPTTDWLETATGLAAGGAQLVLCHVAGGTVSGQRFAPVVQVTADPGTAERLAADLDAVVDGDAADRAEQMLATLLAVASREQSARAEQSGDVGFQITRGLLGTSM
jgi:altronate dehydratase